MTIDLERNINNLNQFWQALNAKEENGVFTHTSWPNKQWRSDFSFPQAQSAGSKLVDTLPVDKSFSTLATIGASELNGLTVKNQLIPMNLTLDAPNKINNDSVDNIVKLNREDSAENWTIACGLAFGYTLDAEVIQQLLHDENASVIAYLLDGNIAGTAISYQTGDTLGIHQLGTVPDFRKMGVAATLMDYLLNEARQSDTVEHVSLQASQAGLHLYEKMGFQALGTLTSVGLTQ